MSGPFETMTETDIPESYEFKMRGQCQQGFIEGAAYSDQSIHSCSELCRAEPTCVYFSQGCSIGCDACDGEDSNPNTRDRCGANFTATNNDPRYRTYNREAEALSAADKYRWNPWRAPGHAPVYDPCGMAGGGPEWVGTQLSFVDTVHNKQGDLGSRTLPRDPTGVTWRAGQTVGRRVGQPPTLAPRRD